MNTQFLVCIATAIAFSGCASTGTHPEGSPPIPEVVQTSDEVPVDVIEQPKPTATTTTAARKAEDDRDTLVCKDIATIGTRFTQRICKSKAQIAEERAQGKAWTDTSRTLSVPGPPAQSAPVGASNSH